MLIVFPKFPKRTVFAGICAFTIGVTMVLFVVFGLAPNLLGIWFTFIPIVLITFSMMYAWTYVAPVFYHTTWDAMSKSWVSKMNFKSKPGIEGKN